MTDLGRIHWHIDGRSGGGEWCAYESLVPICRDMNRRYGAGTHWIERKQPMKLRRSARDEIDEALVDGPIECQSCKTIVEEPGVLCRDCKTYQEDCDAGMFNEPDPLPLYDEEDNR